MADPGDLLKQSASQVQEKIAALEGRPQHSQPSQQGGDRGRSRSPRRSDANTCSGSSPGNACGGCGACSGCSSPNGCGTYGCSTLAAPSQAFGAFTGPCGGLDVGGCSGCSGCCCGGSAPSATPQQPCGGAPPAPPSFAAGCAGPSGGYIPGCGSTCAGCGPCFPCGATAPGCQGCSSGAPQQLAGACGCSGGCGVPCGGCGFGGCGGFGGCSGFGGCGCGMMPGMMPGPAMDPMAAMMQQQQQMAMMMNPMMMGAFMNPMAMMPGAMPQPDSAPAQKDSKAQDAEDLVDHPPGPSANINHPHYRPPDMEVVPGLTDRRFTGVMHLWFEDKGYGFIESSDMKAKFDQDAFLHRTQKKHFKRGDSVEFAVYLNYRGKPQATELRRAERSKPGA
eukprot:TRINITY_DN3503_c1_g3_i1.p1 TRINITY_DN3503_c1_g3~~TRINITY_DN3503_c1_g3_i1.p1  ORF type:complete len:400 (+),score=86.87 TRINITY_DN3503_c1_g3_i1:26-1201(+)